MKYGKLEHLLRAFWYDCRKILQSTCVMFFMFLHCMFSSKYTTRHLTLSLHLSRVLVYLAVLLSSLLRYFSLSKNITSTLEVFIVIL